MDGASSAMGVGVGIVIITSEGIRLEHSFRLGFKASNNEAEYEAFIVGLRTAFDMDARDIEVYSNSRLVVNQVQGSFKARDYRMKEYLKVVKQVMGKFCTAKVTLIARGRNRHADSLATLASAITEDIPWLIKVELITELSINTTVESAIRVNMAAITTTGSCWMDPIIEFLARIGSRMMKVRLTRYVEWPHNTGCQQIGNFIEGHSEDHTFYAFTPEK